MLRLLVGTCVLAVAVLTVRADEKKEEKKSSLDTYQSLFKDLLGKYQKAKTDKERQ